MEDLKRDWKLLVTKLLLAGGLHGQAQSEILIEDREQERVIGEHI